MRCLAPEFVIGQKWSPFELNENIKLIAIHKPHVNRNNTNFQWQFLVDSSVRCACVGRTHSHNFSVQQLQSNVNWVEIYCNKYASDVSECAHCGLVYDCAQNGSQSVRWGNVCADCGIAVIVNLTFGVRLDIYTRTNVLRRMFVARPSAPSSCADHMPKPIAVERERDDCIAGTASAAPLQNAFASRRRDWRNGCISSTWRVASC